MFVSAPSAAPPNPRGHPVYKSGMVVQLFGTLYTSTSTQAMHLTLLWRNRNGDRAPTAYTKPKGILHRKRRAAPTAVGGADSFTGDRNTEVPVTVVLLISCDASCDAVELTTCSVRRGAWLLWLLVGPCRLERGAAPPAQSELPRTPALLPVLPYAQRLPPSHGIFAHLFDFGRVLTKNPLYGIIVLCGDR